MLTTTTTTTYYYDYYYSSSSSYYYYYYTLVGGLVLVMRFKQNAIFRFEHPYGVFGRRARLNVQKTVRSGS